MHSSSRSAARLTSFAVTALWHRRLSRTTARTSKVQPRVLAELLLHPVVSHGLPVEEDRTRSRDTLDACHAA